MTKYVFRKSVVVVIIILFLGASIVPSISGINIESDESISKLKENREEYFEVWWNWSPEDPLLNITHFYKIQNAINKASTVCNIKVWNGTYNENIIIEKSNIKLNGEDPTLVTIDGNGIGDVIKIHGIFGERYKDISIKNFTIQNGGDNGNGIEILFCDRTEIGRCLIQYNIIGIHTLHTADDVISHNKILNNSVGLSLELSDRTKVDNCNIYYNDYGIVTDTSYMLTITGNHIENNSIVGIYLVRSSNNFIYNNYINNDNNALDNGDNKWYIEKTLGTNIIGGPYLGGNYYSDYTGIDTNCDGLGETPYIIGTNNDIYPLTIVNNEYIPPEITITYPIPGYIYSSKGWKFPPGLPIPSWWAQHKFISFGGFDINAIITDNASVDPNSVFAYIKQASGYKYQLHQDPIIPNLYTGHLDTPGIFSCRLVVEAKDMCGNLGKNESMLLLLYISL